MAANDVDTGDHSWQVKTASNLNAVLGVWIVVTPWALSYVGIVRGTAWNNLVSGILVAIFGWLRAGSPHERAGLSWANVALGGWTVLSPWIYGYAAYTGPLWNSVIVGVVVTVLAVWSGSATALQHRRGLA